MEAPLFVGERCIGILTAFYVPAYKGGGPIRTLEALVRHMPERFTPVVLTSDRDLHEKERLPVDSNAWVERDNAQIYYTSTDSTVAYVRGLQALRRRRPAVLYLNSFFDPRFSITPLILARLGWFGRMDVLLAPRGEFSPGALGLKSSKKSIFLRMSKIFGLHRGIAWHASSGLEAQDIRAAYPGAKRVIVKENETLLEPLKLHGYANSRDLRQPLRAVFASRLVPMKGLHILLGALEAVSEDIIVDVIGGEEDPNYVARCRTALESLPNNVKVNFLGPLPHESLLVAIASYDVMLFPTLGENFGHVVAEALSVGLPVYCSDNTPWNPVLADGGGVVVSPNTPEAWSCAISRAGSSTAVERSAMRESASGAFRRWQRARNSASVFDLLEQELPRHHSPKGTP